MLSPPGLLSVTVGLDGCCSREDLLQVQLNLGQQLSKPPGPPGPGTALASLVGLALQEVSGWR